MCECVRVYACVCKYIHNIDIIKQIIYDSVIVTERNTKHSLLLNFTFVVLNKL